MMDPDFELFMAVAAAGSMSGAARMLRISPAMVTKRLVRLESRLGGRLVHRTTRRLSLTPQGQRLRADLAPILAALEEAEQRAAGKDAVPSGSLRVTAPTSFGRLHIAPHLPAFLSRYPDIALELDLSDGFADLFAGTVDLAIRITAGRDPGLARHRLATSQRVLCAAPAYLAAHGTPRRVDQLADHHLLAATGQLPWALTGPDGPVVIEGQSLVRTNSSELVREVAIAGGGIALRSLWDVGPDLEAGRLVRLLADHEGSSDVAIIATYLPTGAMPSAMAAFIGFLESLYQPQPPWTRAR